MSRNLLGLAAVCVVAAVAGLLTRGGGSKPDFKAFEKGSLEHSKKAGRPAVVLATADW